MSAPITSLLAPNGKRIELPTGLFINNQFVRSSGDTKLASINPSDESIIAVVEAASEINIDKAVKAARAALNSPEWAEISGTDRGNLIYKLADLVHDTREDLATLETWDNGKPYHISLDHDVAGVVACLKYYAGWADKIHGQTIPTHGNKFAYTLKQPVGVCGQIIP